MPLGSSSAAPVINPGPSRRRKWICFRGKLARRAGVSAFPDELVTQLSQNRDNRKPPAPLSRTFRFLPSSDKQSQNVAALHRSKSYTPVVSSIKSVIHGRYGQRKPWIRKSSTVGTNPCSWLLVRAV